MKNLQMMLEREPEVLLDTLQRGVVLLGKQDIPVPAAEAHEVISLALRLLRDNITIVEAHTHVRAFEEACREHIMHELNEVVKSTGSMPVRGTPAEARGRFNAEKGALEMNVRAYDPAIRSLQSTIKELEKRAARAEDLVDKKQARIADLTLENKNFKDRLEDLDEDEEIEEEDPTELEEEITALKARLLAQGRAYKKQLSLMANQIAEAERAAFGKIG